MKYLGIDYGTKKVGLAISDKSGEIVFPRASLELVSIKKLIIVIADLIKKEKIEKIIVGWPLVLKGKTSIQTERVEKFIKELKNLTDCNIEVFDERLTTKESLDKYQYLSKTKKMPPDIDALAASEILNNYLKVASSKCEC